REGWAREESEANLRGNLASAMRTLDFTLARSSIVRPDGTVDPEVQRNLQTAVRRVTDAFGDYMMFQFANETSEGRAFVSAQSAWAGKESDYESFLNDYPEVREEIRQHPDQQLPILRRVRQEAHDRYAHNPFDTRSGYDSSLTHNRLATIISAREELDRTQAAFQEMVRRRLQNAPNAPIPVPMHQSADGFRAGLRRDPLQIYQQFQGYLTTRMAYADERRTQGVDATAIERNYAPSPLSAPVGPMDFRIMLDPLPEQNFLGNPLGLPVLTAQGGNSPFVLPTSLGNGSNLFVLPAQGNGLAFPNGIDFNALSASNAAPAPNDGSLPVFYLDGSNHIRPMRAEDQTVTGGVWVYNTESRHFEMVRDLPTLGNANTDLPVIDLTGSNRIVNGPVASLNGRTITIDRTGPSPVVRFVRN
ncbi:MAG TPA: hypothetical protein VFX30_10340, partial [bacterium]|nr:hypothetical protein [bacterium]